jgi:hypothetical protein
LATLTLFSTPKPFTDPKIAIIQRNAIRSWKELGSEVEILLIGDEEGVGDHASEFDVTHQKEVKRNSSGTPLVNSIFEFARKAGLSPLLAYVNADILLLPSFVETARRILNLSRKFLLIGQRWDLDVTNELDFSTGWQERLAEDCAIRGSLHKPAGSDYFIFPKECFITIPDFAIGRAGWDNWMIFESRKQGWQTIDATREIQVIHQNHDYSHLPDGQSHYRLPETAENIRLAGGSMAIFTLADANLELKKHQITKKRISLRSVFRELEILPLLRWNSNRWSVRIHIIFHPAKWLRALQARLTKRTSGKADQE